MTLIVDATVIPLVSIETVTSDPSLPPEGDTKQTGEPASAPLGGKSKNDSSSEGPPSGTQSVLKGEADATKSAQSSGAGEDSSLKLYVLLKIISRAREVGFPVNSPPRAHRRTLTRRWTC